MSKEKLKSEICLDASHQIWRMCAWWCLCKCSYSNLSAESASKHFVCFVGKKSGIKMNGKQTKLCLCVRNCLRQFQSRLLFTRLTINLWTNSLGTTTHQRSLDENQFAQRTFPSNPKRRRRECLQRLHHTAAATREASAENLKLIHQFSPHNLNILCVALHAASVSEIPISKDNFFYKNWKHTKRFAYTRTT